MIKELAKFTKTFESFKAYLFHYVYNKQVNDFKSFPYQNETIIIAKAIEYLEYLNISVIDAFNYYNYQYPTAKFSDKTKNLVLKEFYRLENNIKCKYEYL